jgi:hypothetical protein
LEDCRRSALTGDDQSQSKVAPALKERFAERALVVNRNRIFAKLRRDRKERSALVDNLENYTDRTLLKSVARWSLAWCWETHHGRDRKVAAGRLTATANLYARYACSAEVVAGIWQPAFNCNEKRCYANNKRTYAGSIATRPWLRTCTPLRTEHRPQAARSNLHNFEAVEWQVLPMAMFSEGNVHYTQEACGR